MRLLFVLVVGCLFLGFLPPAEEKIIWEENRKLSWQDFRGIPNGADPYVASTNSGISFSFSLKESSGGTEVDYEVQSNFYPELSWYRPQRVNNYILGHEQTHFDISELYARKLRKKLDSVIALPNFKESAEIVYNQIEFERRKTQRSFDRESDHSNIKQKEYEWRKHIHSQLQAFDAWK